ncbi:uncharacterized protein LOC126891236 [Diabrotica virgifera virgifera]|uniref:Regulatory protein zeste n=1 Tax=Diabrotica virgifera virgifera TaxID=50390 RepID=A0ABM5L1R0_DIAVI|nr:uncharacterized protein LOC126891236 [Diabrotica virgifera virgifera]
MSKSVLNGTKIILLKEIRDKTAILFGSFSDKLTKKDKIECWKTVHQKSTSLGLVPPNKDWTYSRDVFWQNLKKTTMKKVDNRRKTGSGGGTDSKFTEMDNVVLDILGPDNPILCSLGISETWEQDPENVEQEIENSNHLQDHGATNKIKNTNVFISTGSSSVPTASCAKRKKSKISNENDPIDEALIDLKKKKLQHQIEILAKESCLKTLEILKLERELHVTPSKFTASFDSAVTYLINVEESPTSESVEYSTIV